MKLPLMLLEFLCMYEERSCAAFPSVVVIRCEICGDSDMPFHFLAKTPVK